MSLLRKLVGSRRTEPGPVVAKALAAAESVRAIPEIGGDQSKNRELVGIIESLKAAQLGLETGKDREGIPISPLELSERLSRTLGYMKQRGIWARLTAKAGRDTKAQLHRLEKDIAEAARALKG